MTRLARWTLAVAVVTAVALLVPAGADWLVTKDGTRVETQGPWEVRDRLVVFKQPDGTFSSMRLSQVDLEASERLTRETEEEGQRPRKEAEPPPKREVVARLTEKDLPPVGSPASDAEGERTAPAGGGDASEGGREEAEPQEPQSLQIVSWRELGGPEREGTEFVGDVRNVTENTALGVDVTVTLFDEEDEAITSRSAALTSSALPPGQTAGFRASFPAVFHYARVAFDVSGRLVLSGDGEGPEGAAEEGPQD